MDFLMAAFDQDIRHLVRVHVVHGFWKREDQSRLALQVGPPFCSSEQRLSCLLDA
jgi:tyrosyl-DNA phosphodiesterase-1